MWSIRLILLVSLGTLNTVFARVPSRIWNDCGNPESPVHLTQFAISPNPVYLPGDILFSASGYTNETLGSSSLHLSIVREGSWFNVPIPCFRKIGSCTYDEMCTMLDDMINENWLGITRTFGQDIRQMLINNGLNPGLCPQPPQVINIVRNPLRVPKMPAALYWFAEGVYRINVRVTDNQNGGRELVCFNVRLNIKQSECSGFWGCLF
ncbi:GM2 ganglioside activator [Mactra antiquata]